MPQPSSSKFEDAAAITLLLIFWPILLIGFMNAISFVLLNYLCSFLFFIYKTLRRNNETLKTNPRLFWQGPLTILAKVWRVLGRVWHGYEIKGLENIPDSGPALLIDYHSALPLDGGFIISSIMLEKKRKVIVVIDRVNLKCPGYHTFIEVLEQHTGDVQSCVDILSRGDLLFIYPGGMKEAGLSDENYEIIWPERAGFGKVAFAAKPKIIPVFTENCRESSLTFKILHRFFQRQYLKTNKPAWLPFGWLPAKLITHIGKPIEYSDDTSIEEIVQMTKDGLKNLIESNQRIPGSIYRALLDRCSCVKNMETEAPPTDLNKR